MLPCLGRRLLGVGASTALRCGLRRLVGREWEMGAVDGTVGRASMAAGMVVGVVGPPGIGKTRVVREIAA